MTNATIPASAPALTSSRRSLLRGLAALPLISVPAVAASCMPSAPDPIFALIGKHAASLAYRNAIREGDPRQEPSIDAELALWNELVETKPATLAGLAALANHVAEYPDLHWLSPEDGPLQALQTIAAAFRDLVPAAGKSGDA